MRSEVTEPEVTVLITGFQPFKEGFPVNPSWEIAKRLPKTLPLLKSAPPIPRVQLLVHPEPIKVSYQVVRSLVPKLWNLEGDGHDGGEKGPHSPAPKKIDLAIHLGMAGPRPFYSIERRGHRTGYNLPDVDGKRIEGEDEKFWDDVPDELLTDLDLDDVMKKWEKYSPETSDLRISEDAGHYLCDFIYFSSLAHLYRAGRPRKVVFFHVPSTPEEKNIVLGEKLVLSLVRSMVESEMERRKAQWTDGSKAL